MLFKLQVTDLGAADLTRKMCEGASKTALSAMEQGVCAAAHPESLQNSMLITSTFYALAGFFFLLTCRWLRRDMVAGVVKAA